MNRFCIGLLLVAMGTGCITGVQGSGTSTSETRTVSDFSKLSLDGAYQVDVACGGDRRVVLSGDDNLLSKVTTEVAGDTLRVSVTEPIKTTLPLVVTITTPNLTALSMTGAVNGKIHGLHGTGFQCHLSGAGSLQLEGTVDALNVSSSGITSLEALDLHCHTASLELSGAGSARVFADQALDGSISGAGSIEYGGNPATVHPSISGAGSIKKL